WRAGSVPSASTTRARAVAGFQLFVCQPVTDPYMGMMLGAAGVGVAYLPDGVKPVVPPGTTFVSLGGDPVYMNHGFAWSKRGGSVARDPFLEVASELLEDHLM